MPRSNDDDWNEEDCLCQGKVPEGKRIDFIQRVFDEKKQKWSDKVVLRYHQDCPIHGIGEVIVKVKER